METLREEMIKGELIIKAKTVAKMKTKKQTYQKIKKKEKALHIK